MKTLYLTILVLFLSVDTVFGFCDDMGGPVAAEVESGTDVVGNTTVGASTYGPAASRLYCYAKFTPPHSGTLTSIEIYGSCNNSSTDIEVGVYQDDSGVPGARVGTETEFTDIGSYATQWKEFGGLSYSVSDSSTYWLCTNFSAQALTMSYDAGSGTQRSYDTLTYGTAWPATHGGGNTDSNVFNIRATVEYP